MWVWVFPKPSGLESLGQPNPRSRDRRLLMAKPKSKVGQAPALSRALWDEWLQWLLKSRGPRMMVVVKLTGCFGLRAGEAVALKREDIVLHGGVPKICVTGETAGARKSPGEVYIRLKDLGFVKLLLTKGITGKHIRGHKHGKRQSGGGRRRTIEKFETYRAPKTGYLFTARKNAAQKHLSYHAVYLAVRQEAPKFFEHLKKEGRLVPEVAKLRPHSGRAQLITELMGDGLSTAMSMKYARHAVGSVKVHLKYSRL